MKHTIDDLPVVRASALMAHGYIARGAVTALVRFGEVGVEYEVGVRMRQFPNGGFWAQFVCPRCDGGAQGSGCWTASQHAASASGRGG
jgi:hypothetical protein